MIALARTIEQGTARNTTSLVVQALVKRMSEAVSCPGADHRVLRPTVFMPVRRGGILTYEDVVARKV